MTLEFQKYERVPFPIEAVLITAENLEEVASEVGEVAVKDDGTRFIKTNRRIVPGVWEVFVGYYMTRMDTKHGPKFRCYAPNIFEKQYAPASPEEEE